jgi:crotonobetainyl-CoA:carnitine CoA-transferase CaiB-like acyl-CoA transferase
MLALEGIRILDLARTVPLTYCTMLLADLGAEVIKVETPLEPGAIYPGTGVSPHPQDEEGRRRAAYNSLNRNKKSIALNLKSEEARQIFYRLAEKADVILEGFRPGVVKRLAVDYETISKINPGIVYCSLTGYGQDGPYRDLPAHDINCISVGGALGLIGSAGGPPVIPLNFAGDYAGSTFYAAIGILAALNARHKSGRGQYIDLAMTDGVVSLLSSLAVDHFYNALTPERGELLMGGKYPCYNTYETKDGKYISLGCFEFHFWENLCQLAGREDFIPYHHPEGEKRLEIYSFFNEYFRSKTRDEWFDELIDGNIPVSKVYELGEVFSDPQVAHRQMVAEVDHSEMGKVQQVGMPIKFSDTPGRIRNTAPYLGEHTDVILKELGYSGEQIDELLRTGAIGK